MPANYSNHNNRVSLSFLCSRILTNHGAWFSITMNPQCMREGYSIVI